MWEVWDKKSDINGFSAEHTFTSFKHLVGEEVIYIKTVGGRVTQIEGKNTLAQVHGIDPALTNDEFIAAYEAMFPGQNAEAEPTEPTEPEPDETATYAELAQVYAEGVNSIE